jgi:YidC/Oxa1 family membrane protein insertase
LDFIYYPVSGIMWVWHKAFGFFMGYSNPWAWVLSVVFLVFTLRAILFKPFMKQMDSQIKMQAIQPEMKRLREKYKDDRQRLTEEMMKLNKEAGVNPLASCLPALLQAPAFIGLYHVLRNFILSYSGGPSQVGHPINNYFFPASDVTSFHDALLFGGASLSAHLTMSTPDLTALGANRGTMLWVAIPLMILAAIATHLTSRRSVARQAELGTAAASGQMAIMQKLMLWVFPLAVVVIGWIYPLALLFYWLANNTWTFGQLWVGHRIQDRKRAEEEKVVEAAKESATYSTPKPGAKPKAPRSGQRPVISPTPVGRDGSHGGATKDGAGSASTSSSPAEPSTPQSESLPPGMISSNGPRTPRPGARPSGGKPRKKKKR